MTQINETRSSLN